VTSVLTPALSFRRGRIVPSISANTPGSIVHALGGITATGSKKNDTGQPTGVAERNPLQGERIQVRASVKQTARTENEPPRTHRSQSLRACFQNLISVANKRPSSRFSLLNDRPHPGPLLQEREKRSQRFYKYPRLDRRMTPWDARERGRKKSSPGGEDTGEGGLFCSRSIMKRQLFGF